MSITKVSATKTAKPVSKSRPKPPASKPASSNTKPREAFKPSNELTSSSNDTSVSDRVSTLVAGLNSDAPSKTGETSNTHSTSALKKTTETRTDGTVVESEEARSPDGSFSGSYETVRNEKGEVVSRHYSSELSTESEVAFGPETTNLEERQQLEVLQERQQDGTTETSYDKTTESRYADGKGGTQRTEESSDSDRIQRTLTRADGKERTYTDPKSTDGVPKLGAGSPFTSENTVSSRPDGSTVDATTFHDEITGFRSSEALVRNPEGALRSKTVNTELPSKEVADDLSGLGVLGRFGHDSAQRIYNEHLGDGPISQTDGSTVTQTFDKDGSIRSTERLDTTTWRNQDGSRSLTQIDRGKGYANEFQLTKRDADSVSTQSFIEGSEDTRITKEFTDKNGFRTVEVDSITPDAANRAVEDGKPGVESYRGTSRMKDEATIEDLKATLGPEYDRLMDSSPEFRAAVEAAGDSKFGLLDMSQNATIRNGEETTDVSARAIGLQVDGKSTTFSISGESGEWETQGGNESDQGEYDMPITGIGDFADQTGTLAEGLEMKMVRKAGSNIGDVARKTARGIERLSLVGNTVDALSAAYNGDYKDSVKYAANAFEDIGALMPSAQNAAAIEGLGMRTAAYTGRALGMAGSAFLVGSGAYDILANGDPRGAFDMAIGSGTGLGLLGVISAPVSTGLVAAGVGGAMAYDYIDGTDMADVRI